MAHERIKPEFLFDEEKIKKLKQIAPECFEDGKINFETLRQNLGDWAQDEEDSELEHFGLFWPGKKDARRLTTIPTEGTLEPVYGEGLKTDGTADDDGVNDSKNIFIEGENLEVLKILQKSYANKIKMIYIDPPYNTGNDFVYDDDFTEPLQEYLRRTGQVDEEGKPLTTNKKSDGRFHSKWLSMMYPRVRLARNLLREDGVIFISIDENEIDNLLKITKEIFGEENFIATFTWVKKKKGSHLSKTHRSMTEYVICLAKNSSQLELFGEAAYSDKWQPLVKRTNSRNELIFPANVVQTKLQDGIYDKAEYSETSSAITFLRPFEVKAGIVITSLRTEAPYVWNQAKLDEELKLGSNVSLSSKFGFNVLRHDQADKVKRPSTLLDSKVGVGTNEDSYSEAIEIFGEEGVMDYPKPSSLMKYLIRSGTYKDDNFIVLDFFGGSASTAHGYFLKQIEESTNGKFIIVQLPEKIENNSNALKLNLRTIADIAKERIRRTREFLIKKYQIEINDLDFGFKVFNLVNSNYKKWNNVQENNISQLENSLDLFNSSPLREDWNKNKLLTELMLLEGFPLDAAQTKSKIGSNEIVKVESEMVPNTLLICLDDEIEESLIDELELENSSTFICLDSAISNQNKLRLSDKGLIKTI